MQSELYVPYMYLLLALFSLSIWKVQAHAPDPILSMKFEKHTIRSIYALIAAVLEQGTKC